MTAPDPGSLVLTSAHRPALEAGTYTITVSLPVTVDGTTADTFGTTARVHVRGARTALPPDWIESRFPPPSDGHDTDVLPHVVLTRSSLPWERSALRGTSLTVPWLAVLLLKEEELAQVSEGQAELADLVATAPPHPTFPGLPAEKGADKTRVRVLDAPRSLLDAVLPHASWLETLTHVREHHLGSVPSSGATELDAGRVPAALATLLGEHGIAPAAVTAEIAGGDWRLGDANPQGAVHVRADGTELVVTLGPRAVVVSCRTTAVGRYRAFLVSLEGRYTAQAGHPTENYLFDWAGATASDLVRLVVLDSWDFAADGSTRRLVALLGDLDIANGLALPGPPDLPGAEPVAAGFALLPHRRGGTGGAVPTWYRGPFVPARDVELQIEDTRSAAELLLDDVRTGLLVGSYAAAFELARTLLLADTAVALDLARWRSDARRHAAALRTIGDAPHLGLPAPAAPPVPGTVLAWTRRLLLFEGVPFGHLVPDPAMLPPERMRTFRVDPSWFICLLEGILAVGRPPGTGRSPEADLFADAATDAAADLIVAKEFAVSGVLIRSALVAGWPNLRVDGLDSSGGRHLVLRRAALSENVLLVLFRGDPVAVSVHVDPEALHLGRTRIHAGTTTTVDIDSNHILDVDAIRSREFTSDQMALDLIASTPHLTVDLPPPAG